MISYLLQSKQEVVVKMPDGYKLYDAQGFVPDLCVPSPDHPPLRHLYIDPGMGSLYQRILSDDVLVHLRCLIHLEFASAEHDPQPLLLNCAASLQSVIIHIGDRRLSLPKLTTLPNLHSLTVKIMEKYEL
ncbi:hypothetical protein C8J57DRAFT_1516795 [Mycena rebaudengoi]|nr:hypothetical protein C8J57DRAFT_1516795 [Mycena rebaudengoi]